MGTPDWVKQEQKAERRREAVNRVIDRVRACTSLRDAVRLLDDPPSTLDPGRETWSNFAWFMGNLLPPRGASGREIDEYQRLLQVFLAEGRIGNQVVQQFEERLAKYGSVR